MFPLSALGGMVGGVGGGGGRRQMGAARMVPSADPAAAQQLQDGVQTGLGGQAYPGMTQQAGQMAAAMGPYGMQQAVGGGGGMAFGMGGEPAAGWGQQWLANEQAGGQPGTVGASGGWDPAAVNAQLQQGVQTGLAGGGPPPDSGAGQMAGGLGPGAYSGAGQMGAQAGTPYNTPGAGYVPYSGEPGGYAGGWGPMLQQAGQMAGGLGPYGMQQAVGGGGGWASGYGGMGRGLAPLAPWLGSMMGRGVTPWNRGF